jgi:acetyl esterase/lipase
MNVAVEKNIPLWPGLPPGGKGVALANKIEDFGGMTGHTPETVATYIGRPFLDRYTPDRANGTELLVIPGGGYGQVWFQKEGVEIADRFNAMGIAVSVLCYRLPFEGWQDRADVPLQDAQRAMRLIRSRPGTDPARCGVMGFSAGGHLAASLAVRGDAKVYEPVDAADAADARPAFAMLLYPVITMGEGTHAGSRDNLLGPDAAPAAVAAYSCEKLVSAKTPPVFLAQAVDDEAVPFAANSLAFYRALQRAKVASELHAFEAGRHGFALRDPDGKPWRAWPDLALAWAKSRGFVAG